MQKLKKVPAGLMVIPMFLGMMIHSFCPQILEIGSFTTETFSNEAASTIMGVQLLCLGSQLQLKETKAVARRGGVLLTAKFLLGVIAVWGIRGLFGKEGIFGISLLAIVCAITNVNGSIYLSLVSTYGDEKDGATVPILALTNGPFLTLLVLGMTGTAKFSIILLVATVVPIVVGMILGNISQEMRAFLQPGIGLLLPFIGFALGAGMDIKNVFVAGIKGIFLSLIIIFIGCIVTYFFDRVFAKRPGYAGLAACATGANAVGVPAAVALADPTWSPFVETATTQIAAVVIISALVIPFVVAKSKCNRTRER